MNQKTYPWGLVAALLIVLWPLGLYMLIRNMSQTKGNYVQWGRAMNSLSFFAFFLAPVMLIMGFSGQLQLDDGTPAVALSVVCALMLAAGGVMLMKAGKTYVYRGERYEYYVDLLHTEKSVDIGVISDDLGRNSKAVMADLQTMIDHGLIPNGIIDVQNRKLISNVVQRAVKTVICPNCGGTNRIEEGQSACCAYCDSELR